MIRQLLHGCPVCRQRTRHLVFCRYRPGLLAQEAIGLTVGAVALFWLALYVVVGWVVVVVVAIICVTAFGSLSLLKGPPTGPYRADEIVGELYPQPKPRRRAPNKPESKTAPLRRRRRRTAA